MKLWIASFRNPCPEHSQQAKEHERAAQLVTLIAAVHRDEKKFYDLKLATEQQSQVPGALAPCCPLIEGAQDHDDHVQPVPDVILHTSPNPQASKVAATLKKRRILGGEEVQPALLSDIDLWPPVLFYDSTFAFSHLQSVLHTSANRS